MRDSRFFTQDSTVTSQGPQYYYGSKADYVFEVLRAAIVEGKYAPGQKLSQQSIAREMGTSATPVREALRRLQTEGLVVYTPDHGARVPKLSARDLREICEIRIVLETLALEQAMPSLGEDSLAHLASVQEEMHEAIDQKDLYLLRRLNYHFHTILYEKSPSRHLKEVIRAVWNRLSWDILPSFQDKARGMIAGHEELIAAVREGDVEAMRDALRRHITYFADLLSQHLPAA